ncbi:hypothetical protein FSARC_9548 [Fusarium sarcochroum]|uniref:DUF7702 domain-containing protein n=1 Tax=Fusarium sarcochroum TaxID=1208366 RepID=A0A8H4TR30_9HYPO|nr:hypothetical protein FSARC_9548 [Fusarium sarcochroum]
MTTLSTAELSIYAILVLPAIYILIKHGKPGLLGWLYLLVFFSLRIIGGGLALANSSAATLVSSIGLSPLVLAAAGILHEARTHKFRHMNVKVEWIKVLHFHFLVMAGVAILAVGASGLQSNEPTSNDSRLVKVGCAILLVAWLILSGWTIYSARSSSSAQKSDHRSLHSMLLYTVLISMIFIGIRIIYNLVALTSNNRSLNPSTGSLTIRVFLSFLPELITVLLYLAAGLYTSKDRDVLRQGDEYEQALSM